MVICHSMELAPRKLAETGYHNQEGTFGYTSSTYITPNYWSLLNLECGHQIWIDMSSIPV